MRYQVLKLGFVTQPQKNRIHVLQGTFEFSISDKVPRAQVNQSSSVTLHLPTRALNQKPRCYSCKHQATAQAGLELIVRISVWQLRFS